MGGWLRMGQAAKANMIAWKVWIRGRRFAPRIRQLGEGRIRIASVTRTWWRQHIARLARSSSHGRCRRVAVLTYRCPRLDHLGRSGRRGRRRESERAEAGRGSDWRGDRLMAARGSELGYHLRSALRARSGLLGGGKCVIAGRRTRRLFRSLGPVVGSNPARGSVGVQWWRDPGVAGTGSSVSELS